MPGTQLAAHAKSSTLYGRPYGHKSKFFRLDGLLLPFCVRSASSAIMYYAELQTDTIHYNLFLVHLATLPFKRPSLYAFMAFLEFTHTREV